VTQSSLGWASMKLAINQIIGRDYTAQAFHLPSSWQVRDPIHAHQHRHQALTDVHPHAKSEFAHEHGREP
jgi:hypothetical protein